MDKRKRRWGTTSGCFSSKSNLPALAGSGLVELCTYVEGLEHKVDEVTNELIHIRKEIVKMRQDILPNHVKEQMHIVANHVSEQYENMKVQIVEVKEHIAAKAGDIVGM